ncbi:MAG TPA: polysaccharide deacetylase family protein [Caulobacteraceae bacterium]
MAFGIGRAKTLARRVRDRVLPGAIILLYHRVGEPELDPQLLSVSRRHFEEHLLVLRGFRRVPLAQLPAASAVGQPRIAVTFDDGYADNLHNAKPLLDKYETPATMFVSSGYVLDRRPYWWDELQQLLLRPGPLPPTLAVAIGGAAREFPLDDEATYGGVYAQSRAWSVATRGDPSGRHAAYRELCAAIRGLAPDRRLEALDDVRAAIGAAAMDDGEACTADEIRQLREPGLIEIGGHTCTHPILSRLSVAEQQREISQGKAALEEMLGEPIRTFAYPFGTRADYTAETAACVRHAGFAQACSNFEGRVRGRTDPFQLPRYLVRDWDGETFEKKLTGWLRG